MKTLPDPKTRVTAPKHVCSIYRQPEEPLSYLVPFLRAGLERGERCVYIAENKRKFAPVLVALKHAGVAAGAAVRSRALTLVTKSRSRFQDAHFDLRSARSLWREQKANALASGQTGLRAAIEMDWITRTGRAAENWIGFERRITHALAETDCTALCQYDLQRCTPTATWSNTVVI
jgi:hypothetical protein